MNLVIHLSDSTRYEININITTYYVNVEAKLQVKQSKIEITAQLTDELRNA